MEEILLLLKPWYNAIAVLLGFTIIRYLYKGVILKIIRRRQSLALSLTTKIF